MNYDYCCPMACSGSRRRRRCSGRRRRERREAQVGRQTDKINLMMFAVATNATSGMHKN